ncbi:MAG: EAL domain-containing protein [Legionella longbeachae]|nr:EAL domain-containing protein [Legionella longbeachae]
MFRERLYIVSFAIGSCILAIILPIFIAYYLSWSEAEKRERDRLSETTAVIFERIRQSYSEALDTLFYLNKLKTIIPCSQEHHHLIRYLTFIHPAIDEIDYLQNGIELCNSWHSKLNRRLKFTDEIISKDGVKVSINMRSTISNEERMISLRYGNYHILMHPFRFSNIILDPNIGVALVTLNGDHIASSNKPDLNFIKNYVSGKIKAESSQYYISERAAKTFLIIALEPKSYFYQSLTKMKLILMPLGLLLALPIILAIIYFTQRRLSIASELQYAVIDNELSVHYQPILELNSGRCVGAEALVRWFISENESIPPDYFISIAEKSGFISKITKYVIATAIDDMKDILSANQNFHLSINLSFYDLQNSEIFTFLETQLKDTGINRNQIWLEITEGQFSEFDSIKPVIKQMSALGYQFAIDDFGTGYSNLSYLKNLSLDILKIDKSFIDTIGINSIVSGIPEHIIAIAQHLKLKIVAEGIENTKQHNYLVKKHVEYGQGWLFSKALNCESFLVYYHSEKSST